MVQVVDLTINGNLQTGANINIKITGESLPGKIELTGKLPPNPELANQSKEYWGEYRNLGAPYRIKKGNSAAVIDYSLQKIKNCNDYGKNFAENFNIWMKSSEFEPLNNKLRTYLNVSEEIRILVRTEDDGLRKLPWEEWEILTEFTHHTIGFSYLESVPQIPNINKKDKNQVRILAILGHNEGINIIKDQEFLADLPNAEVVFVVQPEKRYINDQLWQQHWDIIFFAGHSETENDIGRIYINSQPDISENSLTTDELWIGLRKAVENGLQLAIFNSCDGLGLSKKINDFLIPQMIIMRDLVPDQVAQEFLKYFLQEYSQGKSLYLAVKEAKERLKILENEFPCANWLPVIFQHPQITPPSWEDLRRKSFWEIIYASLMSKRKYQLGAMLLLFSSMIAIGYLVQPKISEYYNYQARESISRGKNQEGFNYARSAEQINPKNDQVLVTLSNDYLHRGNYEEGREYAKKAWDLGNISGCNSYAFSYIIEAKMNKNIDDKQVKILLDYAKDELISFCLPRAEESHNEKLIYSILKNIGLILIYQDNYPKAKKYLEEAIAIELEEPEGVANCLMAKVLEKEGKQTEETLKQWTSCANNARGEYPEEQELQEEANTQISALEQKLKYSLIKQENITDKEKR